MKPDLKIKNYCIFGLKGSGKTVFCKHLIKKFKGKVFVYDWHDEYHNLKRKNLFYYVPEFKHDIDERRVELSKVVREFVVKSKEIGMFVLDEANQYCFPKPTPLPPAIQDLTDNSRHYGITTVYVARRPTQLHTDLVELSDYRVFFKLTGKNDRRYLDNLYEGMGDMVFGLDKYEFVVLSDKPRKYKPISI